jgi:hypothetical protein
MICFPIPLESQLYLPVQRIAGLRKPWIMHHLMRELA